MQDNCCHKNRLPPVQMHDHCKTAVCLNAQQLCHWQHLVAPILAVAEAQKAVHSKRGCSTPVLQDAGEAGTGEHGAATAAHFFRELTVGGVARPVDTLLMAFLLLYCSQPFGQVAGSATRQLAYVFRVRCCLCRRRHTRLQAASAHASTARYRHLLERTAWMSAPIPCRAFSA